MDAAYLLKEHQGVFHLKAFYAVYEMFGQATQRQLTEVAEITNSTQIKHIIALREVGFQVEVDAILATLRTSVNQRQAEISLWWYMFKGDLTEAMTLKRMNLITFYSVLVSKISKMGLFDQADEDELGEIGNLTGFTILKDLDKLLILPRGNNDGKEDRIQALMSSLIDTRSHGRLQLSLARDLIKFGTFRAKRYYLEQEGGDPESIKYWENYNLDLAEVLFHADEKQRETIFELLGLEKSSPSDLHTWNGYLQLGCYRMTTLDVSVKSDKRVLCYFLPQHFLTVTQCSYAYSTGRGSPNSIRIKDKIS